jgi:hypothetical protein
MASARAEYQQISREWHSWLGFALYLGGRSTRYDAPSDPLPPASASAAAVAVAATSSSQPSGAPKRRALSELPLNQVAKRGRMGKPD